MKIWYTLTHTQGPFIYARAHIGTHTRLQTVSQISTQPKSRVHLATAKHCTRYKRSNDIWSGFQSYKIFVCTQWTLHRITELQFGSIAAICSIHSFRTRTHMYVPKHDNEEKDAYTNAYMQTHTPAHHGFTLWTHSEIIFYFIASQQPNCHNFKKEPIIFHLF